MKIALHSLESASYCTDDHVKLKELVQNLEDLCQNFRSSLPSQCGLNILPSSSKCSILLLRSKKVKQRARKRLQSASKLSALAGKNHPGRKRQNWKIRNRVGVKVEKLKKVSLGEQ